MTYRNFQHRSKCATGSASFATPHSEQARKKPPPEETAMAWRRSSPQARQILWVKRVVPMSELYPTGGVGFLLKHQASAGGLVGVVQDNFPGAESHQGNLCAKITTGSDPQDHDILCCDARRSHAWLIEPIGKSCYIAHFVVSWLSSNPITYHRWGKAKARSLA